jgi:hypothetical protein
MLALSHRNRAKRNLVLVVLEKCGWTSHHLGLCFLWNNEAEPGREMMHEGSTHLVWDIY